jgi:hypothetical protein
MSVAAPARLDELKEAAQQLVREKSRRSSDTFQVGLLRGIQAVVNATRLEKLSSECMVSYLRNLPDADSAWRRLTAHDLARMLRPFGVHPRQLWVDGRNVRGYVVKDFFDTFERYLPAEEEGQDESAIAS